VRERVDDLVSCLGGGRETLGKSMLASLVDSIAVKPGLTEAGRPCHVIRVRGAVDGAFQLLSQRRQMSLVAGAVFVPDANSQRLPLVAARWVYTPARQGAREMRRTGLRVDLLLAERAVPARIAQLVELTAEASIPN